MRIVSRYSVLLVILGFMIGGLWMMSKTAIRLPTSEATLTAVILDDSSSMRDLTAVQRGTRYELEPKMNQAMMFLRPWLEAQVLRHKSVVLGGLLPRAYSDVEIVIEPDTTYWAGDREFITFDPTRVGQKQRLRHYGHASAGVVPELSLMVLQLEQLDQRLNQFNFDQVITPLGDTIYEYAIALRQKFFSTEAEAVSMRMLVITDGIDFFGATSVCENLQKLAEARVLPVHQVSLHIIHYLPHTFSLDSEHRRDPISESNLQQQYVLSQKQQVYIDTLTGCITPFKDWVRMEVIDNSRGLQALLDTQTGSAFEPATAPSTSHDESFQLPEAYHYAREHQLPYVVTSLPESQEDLNQLWSFLAQNVRLYPFLAGEIRGYLPSVDLFLAKKSLNATNNVLSMNSVVLSFLRLNFRSTEEESLEVLTTFPTAKEHAGMVIHHIRFLDSGHPGIVLHTRYGAVARGPLSMDEFKNAMWIDVSSLQERQGMGDVETLLMQFNPSPMVDNSSRNLWISGYLETENRFLVIRWSPGDYVLQTIGTGLDQVREVTLSTARTSPEVRQTMPLPPQYDTHHWQLRKHFYGYQGRNTLTVVFQSTENVRVMSWLTYDFERGLWEEPLNPEAETLQAYERFQNENSAVLRDISGLVPYITHQVEFLHPQPRHPRIGLTYLRTVEQPGQPKIYLFRMTTRMEGGQKAPEEYFPMTFTLPITIHPDEFHFHESNEVYLFSSLNNSRSREPYALFIFRVKQDAYYAIGRRTYFQIQR